MDTRNVTQFYRRLEEVLDLEPGTLKGGEVLSDLSSWDSIAEMAFVGMADENYGVTVPATRVHECKTVDNLAELIPEISDK
jgi:acyl carrier protein